MSGSDVNITLYRNHSRSRISRGDFERADFTFLRIIILSLYHSEKSRVHISLYMYINKYKDTLYGYWNFSRKLEFKIKVFYTKYLCTWYILYIAFFKWQMAFNLAKNHSTSVSDRSMGILHWTIITLSGQIVS